MAYYNGQELAGFRSNITVQDVIIDNEISSESDNPVSNKVIKEYVDEKVLSIKNDIYPVGSIYMSVNATNPGQLFGGTWQIIKDTFLLACGDKYAAGSTGGEAKHTLSVEEMPSHNHTITLLESGDGGIGVDGRTVQRGYYGNGANLAQLIPQNFAISNNGGNMPHNNMPPYLAVHMWQRIA